MPAACTASAPSAATVFDEGEVFTQFDMGRATPPIRNGESVSFVALNRNKRSLVLDLKRPEAVEILRKRVRESSLESAPVMTIFDYLDFDEGRDPVRARAWELRDPLFPAPPVVNPNWNEAVVDCVARMLTA